MGSASGLGIYPYKESIDAMWLNSMQADLDGKKWLRGVPVDFKLLCHSRSSLIPQY